MSHYAVAAPLKLNLSLRVLGKRADGYHDLESLVAFADCADTLRLTPQPDRDSISIAGPFASPILDNADNLALKALRYCREAVPNLPFFHLQLIKTIPMGAGFGGGSADAAAILRLVRDYFTNNAKIDFAAMAQRIGADVPACLIGHPLIMRGIGERIATLPFFPPLSAVLIYPHITCPTAPVFANLTGEKKAEYINPSFENTRDILKYVFETGNDLLPAAATLHPEIGEIARKLKQLFPDHPNGLSGSGSGFFILCQAEKSGAIAEFLSTEWPNYWIKTARILSV